MHWRIAITSADNLIDDSYDPHVVDLDSALWYTTDGFTKFAGGEVTVVSTPEAVADLILNALPEMAPSEDDPAYVS
ncbi:MAG TPA: O-acetyl-ADP-ribose deacetylase, partial [Phycisphaerae bacterium]|nr:O-acetyl-ADP-ribose deacetylase [Phycisphaerae bacterium]